MVMLKWMISEGYGDARSIERRIAKMEARHRTLLFPFFAL
jgi:aconitase B